MRTRLPLVLLTSGLFLGCMGLLDRGDDTGSDDTADLNNAAPGRPVISLEPSEPGGDENLQVVILSDAEDPDGDEVSYTIRWEVDGADAGLSGDTVPAASTNRDEEWRVYVSATDGMASSDEVQASVIIGNTPPTLGAAKLSPTKPGSDETLTCAPQGGSDEDGDSLDYEYDWLVNGSAISATGAQLPPSRFDVGDEIECQVTPFDGEEYGNTVISNSVEVQNGAPSAPAVAISGSKALLCQLIVASVDPDGDDVDYSVRWERNGSSWSGTTSTQSIEDDFIPATVTSAGEEWQCFMSATDGLDTSAEGASDLVEIASAPTSYLIYEDDLGSSLTSDCSSSGDRPYTQSSSGWSFSWTDEGASKPSSLQVDLSLGVECANSSTRTVKLNGTTIGTYSTTYDCECSGTALVETINASSTAAYKAGAVNTITVTGASTANGPQENTSWGSGVYGRVILSY